MPRGRTAARLPVYNKIEIFFLIYVDLYSFLRSRLNLAAGQTRSSKAATRSSTTIQSTYPTGRGWDPNLTEVKAIFTKQQLILKPLDDKQFLWVPGHSAGLNRLPQPCMLLRGRRIHPSPSSAEFKNQRTARTPRRGIWSHAKARQEHSEPVLFTNQYCAWRHTWHVTQRLVTVIARRPGLATDE
jgi:hypothetical protein